MEAPQRQQTKPQTPPTGLDIIFNDKSLMEHWLARTAAYIIDCIVVYLPFYIIFLILGSAKGMLTGLIGGAAFLFYSAFLEANHGSTIGKQIMHLRVVSVYGPLDMRKTFIRNISRIFLIGGPLLDSLIGLALPGDPREKYTDRISMTRVVDENTILPPTH